ncbi:cyclic GMP-AMP synthase DncV-like nucleotidyltransferase [Zoogloea oleivorans]
MSTWLQGPYKYGTLIKPVHPGKEYDVDLGIISPLPHGRWTLV